MSVPNSQRISFVVQNDGTTEIHENGRHIATAYGPDTASRIVDALAKSAGPSERVRLQYEWLAPKLSTEERKSLDVIYAAASSATPEGGKHG